MLPSRPAPRLALLATLLAPFSSPALACGGFFCQQLPIDQAGEQIVFRQQGDTVTAMVRILYTGEAENFSWVVPVPDTPSRIAVGADETFDELDLATRPRFLLERRGEQCPVDPTDDVDGGTPGADAGEGGGGVTIEQTLAVGPFDTTVVSSDNPDDMATWLVDNGYDLSDNGRDLLVPYVEAGMKFVAVKLRNGEETNSIQPLVMEYPADRPMIPIRLTAVATEPDMGVLVWIVAEARAVPENYLHVTPNYARLNWYTGPQNAYASYQALITAAMDEVEPAGDTGRGQGFATDYAGPLERRIDEGLTPSRERRAALGAELAALDAIGDEAAAFFIARAVTETPEPSGRLAELQRVLPLPDGRTTALYEDPQSLLENFTADALAEARTALRASIVERELDPIDTALALLPEGAYLTRLYTTLSAEEMTLDPTFGYNADMDGQSLERRAVLDVSCGEAGTEWTLTLGEGTGRDGERVVTARQPVPGGSVPAALGEQRAAFRQVRTSADAAPEFLRGEDIEPLLLDTDGRSVAGFDSADDSDEDGFLGAIGAGPLGVLALLALAHFGIGLGRRPDGV